MDTVIAKASAVTTPEMYKEFFKGYYNEKMRVFRIVATIIGVGLIAFGLYATARLLSLTLASAVIAAGIVLIIYPRFAYRRPYKRARNNKVRMRFDFYADKYKEKNDGSEEIYSYTDMKKVMQTENYIYIFHTNESASVIDKENIKLMTSDELFKMLDKAINR